MILTEFQQHKQERDAAIRRDFALLQANGGSTTAIYNELAKKYGVTAVHIYRIVTNKI